ncbi:MAG: DUF2612 domain-containing protein [Clostridiales bacterium]|nr:DUF2612 domain-containing protein [Clostridiales bacterium]
MPDYSVKLKNDLVEQFKEQPVIEALMEAIGEQLNDLYAFFEDLRNLRGVQTATGAQLEGVGDIVALTRKEAGELACIDESVYVLDDEGYRNYLIFKIWRNTCDCTYSDIIKALSMFWDKPLYYSESLDVPATMILETGELSPEDDLQKLLTAPLIKAAGVGIYIKATTVTPEIQCTLPVSAAMIGGYQSTTLPELEL